MSRRPGLPLREAEPLGLWFWLAVVFSISLIVAVAVWKALAA